MRLPRYSVRTLLVAVLAVSVILGRISWNVHVNRAQRRVVQSIWQMGGGVGFDEGWFLAFPLSEAEGHAEANRSWFEDAFDRQTPNYVLFGSESAAAHRVDDDDLDELISLLRRLPSVKLVQLDGTGITEQGVIRLQSALPNCDFRRRLP